MYKKKLAGIVFVVAAVAVLSGAGTAGAAPKKIAVSQIAVPRRGPGGPGFHPAPPPPRPGRRGRPGSGFPSRAPPPRPGGPGGPGFRPAPRRLRTDTARPLRRPLQDTIVTVTATICSLWAAPCYCSERSSAARTDADFQRKSIVENAASAGGARKACGDLMQFSTL